MGHCFLRHTGSVLLYDSRHQWIKQCRSPGDEQEPPGGLGIDSPYDIPSALFLSPHCTGGCLPTSAMQTSYVAVHVRTFPEFKVWDSAGKTRIYQAT